MPISPRKIFLAALGLLALTTAGLQAQSVSTRPAATPLTLSRPAHTAPSSPIANALRGINTTVVRPSQSVNYYWGTSSNQWEPASKDLYTYDAGGRPTQIVSQDSATSLPSSRLLLAYDIKGRPTATTYQNWNNNAWENNNRYTTSYDAYGNETGYLSQTWNGSTWTTDFGTQVVYAYNAAGVVTEEIRKEYDKGLFVNEQRTVYTFTNGQWSSALFQEWENGAWQNRVLSLDVVWYDWASRKPASFRTQEYDGTSFMDMERYNIMYSANGTILSTIQSYDGTAWVNDYRISEPYDNYGNELGFTEEQWVNNAWRLEYGDRNLLFYNANNVVLRKVHQRFDNGQRQYTNEFRSNYSNFQTITLAAARNAALEARATLYPNPAAGLVTLAVADVSGTEAATGEVRNALGQLVQQFTARPQAGQLSTQLDLSSLQAGVYTVRLQTSAGSIVKRVVRN
ncbi:T9SS type A sorting domain-containing protein [Hymenobacter elongatus]|uniref:T9SS type A sorting domain-containing protein n=1 Tax=Hymenobacter elongatus TaxID=877208 RepID=A0A4Z0PK88_9BACT|nr:T9SS type A sorting domain-containing protein [Hymenobacter elongatus]TGE14824.1 T9SS type A sorting domain-containing protein [Hymenobacter elongatus]